MGWIRNHWLKVAGFVTFVPTAWGIFKFAVGRAGDADFIISRLQEPGWVAKVINFLLAPPTWMHGPLILLGLALIYWDARRNRRSPQLPTDPASVTLPSPPSPSKPIQIPEDAPRRLAAIDAALDMLEGLEKIADDGNTLRAIWGEEAGSEERYSRYRQSMNQYRDEYVKVTRQLSLQKAERYEDITKILDSLKQKDYVPSLNEFIDNYKRLGPSPSNGHKSLFEPFSTALRPRMLGLRDDTREARRLLLSMRYELVGQGKDNDRT